MNLHVLMFGQGENCLDLVILSLYQFLQLGWASPLLPPWIQTEPCLWWRGLGKVSLSTEEMWSVSQVIYFQIHITEKYNIVICSRISLWVWGPCVFKDKKKTEHVQNLDTLVSQRCYLLHEKCIYVNSLHWYLSIGQNSFHPLYQYEALTQYIGHRSLFVAERYCPHRQQTKYPKAPMLKHFKVRDIFIFLLDCCGFSWL